MGQPLPYYDVESVNLNAAQISWLTTLIYLSTAIFFGQLALAGYNSYAFLYKEEKYKTVHLLVFYILTFILTGLRIFYNIAFYANLVNEYVFSMLGMPIVKINMGLNQCWMLLELSMRVKLSIQLASSEPFAPESDSFNDTRHRDLVNSTERKIRIGSRIVVVSIAVNLIVIFAYLGYRQVTFDVSERAHLMGDWDAVVGVLLFVLFALLLVCVLTLIWRLKQVRNVMFKDPSESEQRNLFDKEINTLWLILGVFNFTYLLRGIWDLVQMPQGSYAKLVLQIILGLFFDCFPVTLLLIFHYRNFRAVKKPEVVKATGESDQTMTESNTPKHYTDPVKLMSTSADWDC